LLVPVDFSEAAYKAVDWAVSLSKQTGARIDLVHVIERRRLFHDTKPSFLVWDRQVIAEGKRLLNATARKVTQGAVPVYKELRLGNPSQEICEMAEARNSDLLVISTHGFTGLKHVVLGSTTEKVVRYAPCSVLVVRGRGRSQKSEFNPKKILVPTDFSNRSTKALRYAVDFAKRFQAQLHVLHVVHGLCAVGNNEIDKRLLDSDLKKAGEKELGILIKALSSSNVSAHTILRQGTAAREIAKTAKELGSDLILIASQGRTGWKRALIGSTTEEVVRRACCPVFVFREEKRSDLAKTKARFSKARIGGTSLKSTRLKIAFGL
jgi:nucleotide-binding universal stress UspA family protein